MSNNEKLVLIRTSGHHLFFFGCLGVIAFLLALAQDVGDLDDNHFFLNICICGQAFFFLIPPGMAIRRFVFLWV